MKKLSDNLLEHISAGCGFMYISDVKQYKDNLQTRAVIRMTDSEAFTLEQWNAAYKYLTGMDGRFSNSENAKNALLKMLK